MPGLTALFVGETRAYKTLLTPEQLSARLQELSCVPPRPAAPGPRFRGSVSPRDFLLSRDVPGRKPFNPCFRASIAAPEGAHTQVIVRASLPPLAWLRVWGWLVFCGMGAVCTLASPLWTPVFSFSGPSWQRSCLLYLAAVSFQSSLSLLVCGLMVWLAQGGFQEHLESSWELLEEKIRPL